MQEIITGYRISGRTWISDAWNAGTLTREDIESAIEDYAEDEALPDEDEIRGIEEKYVLDEMDEDATPEEIKQRLDECVANEMAGMEAERDGNQEVVAALQELYDHWSDDKLQVALVHQAHTTLDDHCRNIQYSEYDHGGFASDTTVFTAEEICAIMSDQEWEEAECFDPEIRDAKKIKTLILERAEPLKHAMIYVPERDEYVPGLESPPIALSEYVSAVEPVIDMRTICGERLKSLWLTVNPYNAVVLNSRNMLIADIDFYDEECRKHGGPANEDDVINNIKLLRQMDDRPTASKEVRFSEESYRVYRTAKGCRVICTSRCFPWKRRGHLALLFMRYLQTDPHYMSLCGIQCCYRARLTPKPWRWDGGNAHVCSLVYEHGAKKIHVALADQLHVHDAVTLCGGEGESMLA